MKGFPALGGVTAIVLILFSVFIGPVFTIMSLNLLFGLSIPLTFFTWLSTFWLTLLFGGAASAASKK